MTDDPLPISALQHYLFCPRQCALIHLESQWAENRLTIEGRHVHERAHDGPAESRPGVRIARGLALRSDALGLWGYADVVEFRMSTGDGSVAPFPIEYKRGKPKKHDADRVQLCAQAMCLEEMLSVEVPVGALYYNTLRRRVDVLFDDSLRATTAVTAQLVREMIASGRTPLARRQKKCDRCSLIDLCLPGALGNRRSRASNYIARSVAGACVDDADPPLEGP